MLARPKALSENGPPLRVVTPSPNYRFLRSASIVQFMLPIPPPCLSRTPGSEVGLQIYSICVIRIGVPVGDRASGARLFGAAAPKLETRSGVSRFLRGRTDPVDCPGQGSPGQGVGLRWCVAGNGNYLDQSSAGTPHKLRAGADELADTRKRHDAGSVARAPFRQSRVGRVLLQSEVAPVSRVVVDVLTKKAPEVARLE